MMLFCSSSELAMTLETPSLSTKNWIRSGKFYWMNSTRRALVSKLLRKREKNLNIAAVIYRGQLSTIGFRKSRISPKALNLNITILSLNKFTIASETLSLK